jgi:hypothetical protein
MTGKEIQPVDQNLRVAASTSAGTRTADRVDFVFQNMPVLCSAGASCSAGLLGPKAVLVLL